MNSPAVRLNITIPEETIRALRTEVKDRGISKFVTEAIREKIARRRRQAAFRRLAELPPAFPEIEDAVTYVREMRRLDEARAKRLGI